MRRPAQNLGWCGVMSSVVQPQLGTAMLEPVIWASVIRIAGKIYLSQPDDLTDEDRKDIEEFRNADDVERITLADLLEELKVE